MLFGLIVSKASYLLVKLIYKLGEGCGLRHFLSLNNYVLFIKVIKNHENCN